MTPHPFDNFPPGAGLQHPAAGLPAAAAPAPGLSREQMEAQLLTLQRYGEAAAAARAAGGPVAGLAALLRQPVSCGPFTLYPLTVSVFIFLKAIGSPLLTVGAGEVAMDDITRALLAFTGPEKAVRYLRFGDTGVTADMTAVHKAAWDLSSQLSAADLTIAGDWLARQMTGAADLVPDGELAANFQTPPVTAPPEAPLPVPARPAGSL